MRIVDATVGKPRGRVPELIAQRDRDIRMLRSKGFSHRQIGLMLDLSDKTVRRVLKREELSCTP